MLLPSHLQIFSGWVVTILFACGICSLFVALGVNSPNRRQVDDVIAAQTVTTVTSLPIFLNSSSLGRAFSSLRLLLSGCMSQRVYCTRAHYH